MKTSPTWNQYTYHRGFSTIELLIAFSVGIIFLSAAIMVSLSDPTLAHQISLDSGHAVTFDATADNSALATSTNTLGIIVAKLTRSWHETIQGDSDATYTTTPDITDISPCLKEISTRTTWNTLGNRSRHTTFGTALSDMTTVMGLGGDCDPMPSTETWTKPQIFSDHNFVTGEVLSIDVLHRFVYITDTTGSLHIYDARHDAQGNTDDFTVAPFIDPSGKNFNDIDVFKTNNRTYALVVRHDTTNQFQVIDVSTPGTYIASPTKNLGGSTPPTGSFPQGSRVYYYDNRAYVTTRETAGFEFHIFDVSSPLLPIELGTGLEINGTVNDIQVVHTKVNGGTYKVAFLVTDRSSREIIVLNVTNAAAPSLLTSVDLPTTNDALSLQLLGNRLYVGRQRTTSGPELFIYEVDYSASGNTPIVSLTPVSSGVEVNTDITYLKVTGNLAFLGNSSANQLQVWRSSDAATSFVRVDTEPLSVGNKIFGIDYEAPYLHIISRANSTLQILHSAP